MVRISAASATLLAITESGSGTTEVRYCGRVDLDVRLQGCGALLVHPGVSVMTKRKATFRSISRARSMRRLRAPINRGF